MTKVLAINSSALGSFSASRQLVARFIESARAVQPSVAVTVRDVATDTLPHLLETTVGALRRGAPETDAEKATRALSDTLIAELQNTDVLVIGSPMYNLGITSTLKTWFDHILRAGATFQYTAKGVEGLVKGKRAVVIETRGGMYSSGPGAALDAQQPHLKAMLGMIGITDVTFVLAESLAISPESKEKSMAAAGEALDGLAKSLIG